MNLVWKNPLLVTFLIFGMASQVSADEWDFDVYLDGKKVAQDLDAWAGRPKVGEHTAELRAKGAVSVSVKFSIDER